MNVTIKGLPKITSDIITSQITKLDNIPVKIVTTEQLQEGFSINIISLYTKELNIPANFVAIKRQLDRA